MDILFMIVVMFAIVSIMTRNSRNLEARISLEKQEKQSCPPHKWTYRKQPGTGHEYMVCDTCKMLPGGQYVEGNDAED